jgi:hypothetical protein
VTIGTTSALGALKPYKATEHEIVAAELAFAFNPLELPYWQAKVRTSPERWPIDTALPDAVVRQATDLTPLEGLSGLQWLALINTAVADLTPVRHIEGLRTVDGRSQGPFDARQPPVHRNWFCSNVIATAAGAGGTRPAVRS